MLTQNVTLTNARYCGKYSIGKFKRDMVMKEGNLITVAILPFEKTAIIADQKEDLFGSNGEIVYWKIIVGEPNIIKTIVEEYRVAHANFLVHKGKMEDSFPYMKARRHLDKVSRKALFGRAILGVLDTRKPKEVRLGSVFEASKIIRKHPELLEYAEYLLVEHLLDPEADVDWEVFKKIPEPLKGLYIKTFENWWPSRLK